MPEKTEVLRPGSAPDPAQNEIERLADFLLDHFPDAIGADVGAMGPVDVTLRLLASHDATAKFAEVERLAKWLKLNFPEDLPSVPVGAPSLNPTSVAIRLLGDRQAKWAHLLDLYKRLGVEWGEDPFAALDKVERSLRDAKEIVASLDRTPDRVFADVLGERIAQDLEWGGPDHDDAHTVGEWRVFIERKIRQADLADRDGTSGGPKEARHRLVQLAALAVAAIESLDRKYPEALRWLTPSGHEAELGDVRTSGESDHA